MPSSLHFFVDVEALYQRYLQSIAAGGQVCTDTRKIKAGDIFFALKGPSFDGNQYALKALESGALCAVVDDPAVATDDRFVLVEDVLTTLQNLGTYHRRQLGIPILAITGSNGKTTTKELLHAVLSADRKTGATAGNFNNHIGVPLTLLSFTSDLEFGIVEMGANHQKEIAALSRIAEPDYGLITNIGLAHLEGFGGPEGVKKGKGELFDYLRESGGTIFCWTDSQDLEDLVGDYGRVIRYGSSGLATGQSIDEAQFATMDISLAGAESTRLQSQLIGSYNVPNMLAAAAVGLHFGVTPDSIIKAIEGYHPDNNRSEWKRIGSNDFVLDAYNANPSSVRAALKNFKALERANKIIVLGDMLELGEFSEQEHRDIAIQALDSGADLVVLVGPLFEAVKQEGALYFNNSVEAGADLARRNLKDSTLLIKGSRGIALEKVVEALS